MAIEKINLDKCFGCGACVNTCPMDVIRLNTPVVDNTLTSCRVACPANVNIRGFISLLRQGKPDLALKIIRENVPLPALTGHVCFHPCERDCARNQVDDAVNINALERYLADYSLREKSEPTPRIYCRKTAIIGSGPAGLAAAYYLAKMGYHVTVFESMPEPGGMLRYGIPEYRLPLSILQSQIEYIRGLGIRFRTGTALGKDITVDELLAHDYQALLIATGAPLGRKPAIEGVEFKDVHEGLDFLIGVRAQSDVKIKKRVVVIGGGNVALDVAQTVLRLGARLVSIYCLEPIDQMPAHDDAVAMAMEEGIKIHGSWGPKKIIGNNGRVTEIQLVRCRSVYDRQGNFCPRFDESKKLSVGTDMVIFAIGESPDLSVLPDDISTDGSHILADPVTMQTSRKGVFAAGVCINGPRAVVEAMASGRKAAFSIDTYLRGQDLRAIKRTQFSLVKSSPREGVEKMSRQQTRLLAPHKREGTFEEIKLTLKAEAAEAEAQRCMACGSKASIKYLEDCMTCYSCERECPQGAIFVAPDHIASKIACWG